MKTSKIPIHVTQEAIDRAVQRSSGHCAIAESIKEGLPGVSYVSVDLQTIRFTDSKAGKRYSYLTPRIAQLHLINYDQGGREALEPFSFKLSAPVQVRNAGKQNRGTQPVEGVTGASEGKVPKVKGGRAMPVGSLSNLKRTGKVRTFGLRALDY